METKMPLVTIIIPFLNAKDTLSRCVESVIRQTYTNWELLLVDNGSTDNSDKILQPHIDNDSRIKLLHCPQKGVSNARNLGLDNASGEYVCFVDADDYVDKDYLSCLTTHTDNDLVICGYVVDYYDKNGILLNSQIASPQRIDNCSDLLCLKDIFKNGFIHICCNKLYKNSIIQNNSLRFETIPVNEDFIFALDYLKHCSSIYISDKTPYHWVKIEGQMSGVMSVSESIIEIYNKSHLKLREILKDNRTADQIAYLSYNMIVFKIFNLTKKKIIHPKWAFNKLKQFHKNKLVTEAYQSYTPQSRGEQLFYFLQKSGLFRVNYHLLKLM